MTFPGLKIRHVYPSALKSREWPLSEQVLCSLGAILMCLWSGLSLGAISAAWAPSQREPRILYKGCWEWALARVVVRPRSRMRCLVVLLSVLALSQGTGITRWVSGPRGGDGHRMHQLCVGLSMVFQPLFPRGILKDMLQFPKIVAPGQSCLRVLGLSL